MCGNGKGQSESLDHEAEFGLEEYLKLSSVWQTSYSISMILGGNHCVAVDNGNTVTQCGTNVEMRIKPTTSIDFLVQADREMTS